MNKNWLPLIGMSAAISAIALVTQGCATQKQGSASALGKPARVGGSANAQALEGYVPIIVKAAASPTSSALAKSKKARIQSVIPTGEDRDFEFPAPTFPDGVTSITAKVRVFRAPISDIGGYANIGWDPTNPLPVFPGTTAKFKLVTLSTGNVGTVKINVPTTYAGENLMLLITKDIPVGSGTWHYGGGEFIVTEP